MNQLQFKILDARIGSEFPLPQYASSGSAGLDLIACPKTNITVTPQTTILIPTGIAIYIADPNYCATILPRSGLGHKHGIVLGNLIGLIDSDYQGELMLSCWNRSNTAFEVVAGMRLAQLVILEIFKPKLKLVSKFTTNSTRGEAGFGSTGILGECNVT